MNQIGEIIAKLRREKDLTQDAVAQAVGVSTQAVSKWERGGVPDVELLPAIADFFGVSVDTLFGRDYTAENLSDTLAKRIINTPEEKRMELAFELAWVMEKALFGKTDSENSLTSCRADCRDGKQHYSRITMDTGFSEMGIAPLSYFLLVPENEDFTEKLTADVSFCELFRDLSEPDILNAFLFLYKRPSEKFFTEQLLVKHLGISEERASEIIGILKKYGHLWTSEMELDEQIITTYKFSPHPGFPALLIFAREMIKTPNYFHYHKGSRRKPYF